MRTSLGPLTAFLLSAALHAQVPDTLWTRTYGGTNIDVGYSVVQCRDSGYAIAGYTRSYGTGSGRNVLLILTDPSGNPRPIHAFGGNSDDEGNAVCQTFDGGWAIAGYTKSFGAGGTDVYFVKTDTAGNESWSKVFGGTQDDEAYAVKQTADSGFIIAGATSSFGTLGSRDVWLIKTNRLGNEVWKKSLGGNGSDGARAVLQTADSGYVLTGWTYSYGPGSIGNVWLVKTDTGGTIRWHKFFGGTDVDRGYDVQETADHGFIICGYTSSYGFGLDDLYLIKTTSTGDTVWTRTFGGSGRDYGNAVRQTSDGGYLIAGYTLSSGAGGDDVWIVKVDSNGTLGGSRTYGGTASDVAYSMAKTDDGGFVVAGHTLSRGAGVHDVWLLKLAPDVTGVGEEDGAAASGFRLMQNYPNPFNPSTTVPFTIVDRQWTMVKVFDVLGRDIATLVNEAKEPGTYSVRWDATGFPGGVYFYRLTSGARVQIKKMLLLK